MGRKKGKQSGDFPSKSQYALHRHTLYVDHAAEADRYRLGRGFVASRNNNNGSSNSSNNDCAGYWHAKKNGTSYYGGGGGRDKWSTLFSSTNTQINRTNTNTSAAAQQQHSNTIRPSIPTFLGNINGRSNEDIHHHHRSSSRNSTTAATAAMGLSRLRSLLEERRMEDRLYEREHRLRLQRSRLLLMMMMENNDDNTTTMNNNNTTGKINTNHHLHREEDRHEPGWLLSFQHHHHPHHHHETNQQQSQQQTLVGSNNIMEQQNNGRGGNDDVVVAVVPSLQLLAAQTLGPVLPLYCITCGAKFVGKSLKSISDEMLSELTIALATHSSNTTTKTMEEEEEDWPHSPMITNGVVRAIMYSGLATGIVLRGRGGGGGGGGEEEPLPPSSRIIDTERKSARDDNHTMHENDDGNYLNDDGLLSLCPRILPSCHGRNDYSALDNGDGDDASCNSAEEDHTSSWEHWEVHDFDMRLNSRMMGCFHLKRLELIDIPFSSYSGGITIRALGTLLRSCSGITHLSLSGCFGNLEDATVSAIEDLSVFLGGNQSVSSLSHCIDMLGKHHGNVTYLGEQSNNIFPYLDFLHSFEECTDDRDSIPPINSMLPDLKVLDVSNCGWVTPEMIIRLLLNGWKRCLVSISDDDTNQHEWEEAVETSVVLQKSENVYPTLRYVNIRGCTRLQSGTTPWMEEWRRQGLFDGIDVSTERQVRM